jgi:hypothetical protein
MNMSTDVEVAKKPRKTKKEMRAEKLDNADGKFRVATFKIEVAKVPKETNEYLLRRSRMEAELLNRMAQYIVTYHILVNTRAGLIAYQLADQAYRETNPRPQLPRKATKAQKAAHDKLMTKWNKGRPVPPRLYDGKAFEKVIGCSLYKKLAAEFPEITVDAVASMTQPSEVVKMFSVLGSTKTGKGSMPGWMQILVGSQRIPAAENGAPLLLHKRSMKFSKTGGKYRFRCDIGRAPGENGGRGNNVNAEVDLVLVKLRQDGSNKIAKYESMVSDIVEGKGKFATSKLVRRKGKWSLHLACYIPVKQVTGMIPGKRLRLSPGEDRLWNIEILLDGKVIERWSPDCVQAGRVKKVRKLVRGDIKNRHANYTYGIGAHRGHGMNRALGIRHNRGNKEVNPRWNNFVSQENWIIVNYVIAKATQKQCSEIEYIQPVEEWRKVESDEGEVKNKRINERKQMLLSKIGNAADSGLTWKYFQVGDRLNAKVPIGIKSIIAKGEDDVDDE